MKKKKKKNYIKRIKKFWKSLGKYEKEFFKAYLFLWFLIGIIHIISFFTEIKEEWIKVFSSFIIYITLGKIGWNIFIRTEDFEKWLLDNFSRLIFFVILIFLILPGDFVDININIFYIIGGLFTFWYGYKKYEKDKEIKFISDFVNDIEKLSTTDLINHFYKLDLLYDRGYIDKSIYNELSEMIAGKIYFKIFFDLDERNIFDERVISLENRRKRFHSIEKMIALMQKNLTDKVETNKNIQTIIKNSQEEKNQSRINNEKHLKEFEKYFNEITNLLNHIKTNFN